MGNENKGAEYLAAYDRLGSIAAVAREYGVTAGPVSRSISRYKARQGVDPLVNKAMDHSGLELSPSAMWVKTHEPDADGNTYSFLVRPSSDTPEEKAQGIADAVAAAVSGIAAVKLPMPKKAPERASWVGLIPINDLHVGAYAWGRETGKDDWDTGKAIKRLREWAGNLLMRMPEVGECVLLFNGDTLHANDNDGLTPKHKNILDVDSRHFKVVDETAEAIIAVTDMAAQKFKKVRLVIKPGNHDPTAYLALLMAAKHRYAAQKNVHIDMSPGEFWAYQFGKVFLFSHHGDKGKPEALVHKMAGDFRKEWGASQYCYVWTGDKHHRASRRIGGAMWEQASCVTEPDAYAANGAWASAPEMQAIIYDPDRGEVERHRVAV